MDGAGHHCGGDGRDVPGQEEKDEGPAHDVEERDRAKPSPAEDRHPPRGDAHADAHDQVEDKELDADAGDVAEIPFGEELRPAGARKADEEDAGADDDEAFDERDQELGRDDGEGDDDHERRQRGHEAREHALEDAQALDGVEDLVGEGQALVEDAARAQVGDAGGRGASL